MWVLAGLSVQSPLKAALTGLELLLARAQIWEESAAKHVSLGSELEGVAALATRWRRLELAAWRNLLNTTRSRHAAGQLSLPASHVCIHRLHARDLHVTSRFCFCGLRQRHALEWGNGLV